MAPTLKLVYGGASFGSYFKTPEEVAPIFNKLKEVGIDHIDTAKMYGESEALMGQTPGHKDFTIDTKWAAGFQPGSATKENIIADGKDSAAKIGVQFDIFYLHAPDPQNPIEETLAGVNEIHKAGIFKRLGLSNYTADQVRQIYAICKQNNYILPTVYQANYSAVARKNETILFPTLRELGISIYAYSPIAGGFLVKTRQQIQEGESRWGTDFIGQLYNGLYNRPSYLEALDNWNAIAEKEGVSKAELAYRWIASHSHLKAELGDAIIFGASKLAQIDQTAAYLKKGPLSPEAVKKIEEIWTKIEPDAPVDNYEVFGEIQEKAKAEK